MVRATQNLSLPTRLEGSGQALPTAELSREFSGPSLLFLPIARMPSPLSCQMAACLVGLTLDNLGSGGEFCVN